ncbi:MAG: serine hydroxymethyltransferase [Erysipelotrichaceae bacterium]|jgi:glycine hydroxymethyltransferase|nr:serine hydroxymethyltransferase [Erysipelotrichaceae bacterium]
MNDKELFTLIEAEASRQLQHLELIASENYVSKDVLKAQGSILTNKYAEGYPGKRYYGGCEFIDQIESLAIDRATKLFGCAFANVQPHSGTEANLAAYNAVLKPGDKILAMSLSSGGHLSHGTNLSLSGKIYQTYFYDVNPQTEILDYDALEKMALEIVPQLLIVGASAYSRLIDYQRCKEIAVKCGAVLLVDMAHVAGLIAAKVIPSCFPYADIVTSTTHKTLRGPRGGLILTNDPLLNAKINKSVFPGIQGGPLMHVIAAKAVCFKEAMSEGFINYQKQVIKNARVLSEKFQELGYRIISGKTENHLFMIDVFAKFNMTGKRAEELLESVGITVNKNSIPHDLNKPNLTSGIRIGTPYLTTLGFKEETMEEIALLIDEVLKGNDASFKAPLLISRVQEIIRNNVLKSE